MFESFAEEKKSISHISQATRYSVQSEGVARREKAPARPFWVWLKVKPDGANRWFWPMLPLTDRIPSHLGIPVFGLPRPFWALGEPGFGARSWWPTPSACPTTVPPASACE